MNARGKARGSGLGNGNQGVGTRGHDLGCGC